MLISQTILSDGSMNRPTKQRLNEQHLEGEIHSYFKQTINIVLNTQFPNMITLGRESIRNAPNSIVVTDFENIRQAVSIGDRCVLEDEVLYIGDYATLNLRECDSMYQLQDPREGQVNYQALITLIESCLEGRSPYTLELSQQPFIMQFQLESTKLQGAILQEDWQQVKYHGRRLIGLGIGLTPTGDDYLTGLLLTLQLKQDLRQQIVDAIFSRELDQTVLEATNLISQHQLYFALQGEAKPSLLSLVQAFQGVGEIEANGIPDLVADILSIGSTSGYDLMSGVLAALEIIKRMECK